LLTARTADASNSLRDERTAWASRTAPLASTMNFTNTSPAILLRPLYRADHLFFDDQMRRRGH
jgi:hypothetical protein